MDLLQSLFLSVSSFLLFFAPGFVILKNTGLKRATKAETILLSVALSLALIPIFSSVMDFFAVISEVGIVAVHFSFVMFLSFLWFVSNRHKSNVESRRTSFPKRENVIKIILLASIAGLAFANWHSAIGIHSIDMGWHVFWTKEILVTNRIPDYSIIEPLDQASRFTYGPHIVIAELSLLSTVPLDEVFWLLAVIFSFANLLAIILIAQRVTGSFYAGLVSGVFYGTAFLSGGYIQRGNIADIFGFFLLSSFILIIEVIEVESLSVVLATLLLMSIFVFHPYAGLAATAVMFFFFILMIIVHHRRAIGLLKPVRAQLKYFPFWVVTILLIGISISKLPYANYNSPGQLQSSNWSAFVAPLSYYPNLIGPILLVSGILGIVFVWSLKATAATTRLVLTSWIVVLFLLANGPLWYLQVEPNRFLWRMIEPLSVFAGVEICSIYYFLGARTESIWNLRFFKIQITHKTDRSRKIFQFCLVTCICTIMIAQSFALLISLDRYAVAEPYFVVDKSLGNWLYQNTNSTDIILVNADVDNTATWIQAFASRPHFLYKVEFATRVAVMPYRQVFLDMSNLYNNASCSIAVLDILKKYDVSYIVVHGSEVSRFMTSPFFTPIYVASQATIFKPFLRTSYGEVVSAEGWLLNTASERQIALFTELEMTYNASESMNLTIPINSHVTDPPIPATGFAAYVDGNVYEQTLIEDGTIADIHTDYSKFWSDLRMSGVGNSYLLTIRLAEGIHSIRIVKTSDSDFEIYISDLVSQGIVFDLAFLHS